MELIKSKSYDIYFVDYRLGAKTGVDLLKEALEHNCEEPIILLTGKGNKAIDIEAMRLGATDYLVKSELNSEKLERCIRYAIERSIHLKALRNNEQKFRNIFERSKDAIFIADKNLYFRDFNHMSYVLFGYEREELQQMCLYDLVPEELDSVMDLLQIAALLQERGYALSDVEAIMGGNMLRQIRACLP